MQQVVLCVLYIYSSHTQIRLVMIGSKWYSLCQAQSHFSVQHFFSIFKILDICENLDWRHGIGPNPSHEKLEEDEYRSFPCASGAVSEYIKKNDICK